MYKKLKELTFLRSLYRINNYNMINYVQILINKRLFYHFYLNFNGISLNLEKKSIENNLLIKVLSNF